MGATVRSEAREVSPEKAKKGNKKSNKKGAKPAATDTPSGDAPLKKKAVSKKAAAGKKDTRKKLATKKSADKDKAAAGRRRKSSQDKPAAAPGRPGEPPAPDEERAELPAAGAPITTAMPGAVSAGPPPGDPNSLSWMAAQAVKALNAVKVAQAEQAAAERAGQKVVAAVETTSSAGTPESAQTLAGDGRGDIPAPVEADAGERPVPVAEPVQQQPEQGASEDAPVTPPAHELDAAAATRRRSPVRPIVLVGLVAVVGVLAYRYWNTGQDALPTAPPADESRAGALEPPASMPVAPVIGALSPAPPSASAPAPALSAAPAAKAGSAEPVAPTADAPGQEQAAQAALVVPRAAADPQEPESPPDVVAMPPETQTAQPAQPEPAQTQPKAPDVAAVIEPPARPAAPRPQYRPPGYGYYPPPVSWPRYYGPAYPQPPSR